MGWGFDTLLFELTVTYSDTRRQGYVGCILDLLTRANMMAALGVEPRKWKDCACHELGSH